MKIIAPLTLTSFLGVSALLAHDANHTGGDGTGATQKAKVEIKLVGDKRVIEANGIADHTTGKFPNRGNPHSIEAQSYKYQIPAKPKVANKLTALGRQPFGIAVNGVPFDPGTAEYWNGDRNSAWRYEALSGKIDLGEDKHHAHVQPTGAYHYHGIPTGLLKKLSGNKPKMVLIGWAADGFPIYGKWGYVDPMNPSKGVKEMKPSYALKAGNRPGKIDPASLSGREKRNNTGDTNPGGKYDGTFVQDYAYKKGNGDLDAANGRFGVTPEFPKGIYHYYVTTDFPFIPRFYKGTPDKSFERKGRGSGGGQGGGHSHRRPHPPRRR
eukprot:Seg11286.5 transcript_id=Seg11286.5/GoldUCD/mRNA.D3Y31 product="hypothetical protein" protein_id=Seg11286.5/GoldUCD/D3Y31